MASVKRVRAKVQSEAAIQRAILKALELKGRLAWRLNAGLTPIGEGAARRVIRGSPAGTPDLIVQISPANGLSRFGFLEVKRAGGKLSPGQTIWHAKAAQRGVAAAVVSSVEEALLRVSIWDGE